MAKQEDYYPKETKALEMIYCCKCNKSGRGAVHVNDRCIPDFLHYSTGLQTVIGPGNRSLYFVTLVSMIIFVGLSGQEFYGQYSKLSQHIKNYSAFPSHL